MKEYLLVLLVGLVLTGCKQEVSKPAVPQPPQPTTETRHLSVDPTIEQMVAEFKKMGFIKKIDYELKEVQVNLSDWINIPYDGKETFAKSLAYHIATHENSDFMRVLVRDYQSGQELAKYSSLSGFKVF